MAVETVQLRYIGPDDALEELTPVEILKDYERTAHLGDSENSRRTYLAQARLFLQWLEERDMPLKQVTADTIADWRRHIQGQGLKPATLALKLVSLRKFLLWAREDGHLPFIDDTDLATRRRNGQKTTLAPPKVHQEPVRYLDFDELQTLLEAPMHLRRKDGILRANARRDAVILSLLALRGLREGELAQLTVGSFQERGEGAVLRVTGKGRKQRELDLDRDLWALVKAYLRETDRSLSPAHRGKPLLLGQRGPMTAQGIIDVVRRHGQRALDRDDTTPHMLRRTFATLASREVRDREGNVVKPAIPPYLLQRLLGHEDLKTTQRYVNAAAEADGVSTATYLGVAPPRVPSRSESGASE